MRSGVLRSLPVVGIAALVMGFLALPGQEERVTMLLRDGKTVEARHVLTELYRAGDRRPQILIQLATLEDVAGDVRASVRYFEDYTAIHPADVQAVQRLADLYPLIGDEDKSYAAQELALRLAPSAERASRLLALYRLNGRTNDEYRLLKDLTASDSVAPTWLERLGTLAASRRDFSTAADTLRRLDAVSGARETSSRVLLFDVLMRQGHFGEALERARRWSASWKDASRAADFALAFVAAGQERLAQSFAREAGDHIRGFELMLASTLARHGSPRFARQVLKDWAISSAEQTPEEMASYISLTSQTGDALAPLRLLSQIGRDRKQLSRTALLAEGILDAYGANMIAPMRGMLTPDVLRRRPLFAAKLMLAENNTGSAIRYYRLTDFSKLSAQERRTWILIGKHVDSNALYRQLRDNLKTTRLDRDCALALAGMAAERGDQRLHRAALALATQGVANGVNSFKNIALRPSAR